MLYSLRCVRVWPIKLPISGRWAILMSASRRCDWRGDTAPAHAGTLLITYSVCGHLSDRAYLCSVTLLCRLMFSSAICVVQCDQLWGAWRSFTYRAVHTDSVYSADLWCFCILWVHITNRWKLSADAPDTRHTPPVPCHHVTRHWRRTKPPAVWSHRVNCARAASALSQCLLLFRHLAPSSFEYWRHHVTLAPATNKIPVMHIATRHNLDK